MGSSKKRKEKREKKKHKKRSRSRSHDRSKRSHKHSREKKHRHDSRSKDPDYDQKKYPESSEDEYVERNRTVDIRSETSGSGSRLQAAYVSSPASTTRRIVEHYSSEGEDDFDPESLLEEKLLENEVYSSRSSKPPKKNYPNVLETLMGKDYPNLEVFRQVIMKGDGVQNFPGNFQISVTNRMAESIPTVRAEEDSQDQFEYLPPQKKIKVKEEPVYETERHEHQYGINEWEDTDDQPVASRPSQQSLSISDMNKLRAKLGLKPLQETKTIPGIEPESGCTGFSQPLHSVAETSKVREKPSMRSSQAPTAIPGLDLEPDTTVFEGQESLSISETNKLRAQLGLRPLQVTEPIPAGVEAEPESPKQNQQSQSITEASKPRAKMSKKSMQVPKPVAEVAADPDNEGQSQLSLSISQTNELRAKLGLKPLQVTESIPGLGAAEDEKQATASTSTKEVFVKTENLTEKKEAEKLREKLKTHREKRKIVEKLSKVKGIADSDSDDESAATWVKKSRKLEEEKEKAEKRAKLLEEMDAEFGVSALVEEEFEKKDKSSSYTAANLRGLTVSHGVDSFKEGHDIILTLKDKEVLNEEEDVLENVNLIDEERYAKNVENRKKKPVYVPYEEPEFDEFGILKKKNILSKYDEEENNQKKTFKLGDENYQDKEKELELIRMKLKQKQGISLEMSNMKVASEYYTTEEMVQFKKPKKKVRKVRRRILKADDLVVPEVEETSSHDFGRRNYTETELDDAFIYGEVPRIQLESEMETNEVPVVTEEQDVIGPSEDLTGVVVDEDQAEKELSAALNKAKRLKQRKTVVSAPEKIVEMIKKSNPDDMDTTPESKSAPIVLNCTAEFCRTLGEIPTYGMSGNRDEEADELLDFERELIEERKKQEMEAQNRGAWNEVDIDEKPAEILVKENEPILEEEPDIRIGVAGALALAQKKGYLDKDTKKAAAAHRVSQLQAQSYTIEEKFYDDDKFGKRDRYTGPIQDFREKLGYKPDIKLEYIDDSGRLLTAKEAFRYLSHKFHGKGPGKNKVDKRMKKLEQETRLKQMSSTDTPLNTVKLLQAKQKEMQSPYIVLSGGSKTLTQTMISKTKPA